MDKQTKAVSLQNVSHHYGKVQALDNISLEIPHGQTVGLIGPDGVGKSTLMSLISGVKVIQEGKVEVLGGDMADKDTRLELSHRIAFMPQGLGHNLYRTLTVRENIDFHASLFGLAAKERAERIQRLVDATGLAPFIDRAAGKLSGGMKQKLSLCCALVHNPDLLILDEPTTGVDPLSRRQFWALVNDLRQENIGMTVMVATAYIEEAQQFEQLLAMDAGKLLTNQPTQDVLKQYHTDVLEEAYIKMLPPEKQTHSDGLKITPFVPDPNLPPAIEAHGLTKSFGNFTAVDHVSFTIQQGEIFGFLGSNGCGKSTTMKMLTGLLEATEGTAELLGKPINAGDMQTKMHVGYMSQAFSLYEELSVRQNLTLHAELYQMGDKGPTAVEEALQQFDLADVADTEPSALPLGIRQRLQLAAACLHHPQVLILDEPTSGVDPAARDMFWRHLLKLSREDKITIFVSTHFMNEAARCDRISFMHRGRVLAVGTPTELTENQHAPNLEESFVRYLIEAQDETDQKEVDKVLDSPQTVAQADQTIKADQHGGVVDLPAPAQETAAQQAARVVALDRGEIVSDGQATVERHSENQTVSIPKSADLPQDKVNQLATSAANKTSNESQAQRPSEKIEAAVAPTIATTSVTPAMVSAAEKNYSSDASSAANPPVENQAETVRKTDVDFSDGLKKDRPSEKVMVQPSSPSHHGDTKSLKYWFAMVWTFARRESKELIRDKIRLFFAVCGPIIMMAAVAWGVTFDVQNLKFSVYDRDQTTASRELVEYFAGSRYFIQQPPLTSEDQVDTVLQSSKAVLVIDIPSGFGRKMMRGEKPEVAFYIDGAMPFNASNIQSYVAGILTLYAQEKIKKMGLPISLQPAAGIEPRFRYNQDFKSINAIAPGVIMLVLMIIPAMMTAIGVVREKEIGSISNLYSSPSGTSQYLIGKQLPYIVVGMVNFLALWVMMVFWFHVPVKGSVIGVLIGTLLAVFASTSIGLLISTFVRSQLAAIAVTAIGTMIPTVNYSGFLYPLSTINGVGHIVGLIFPASWFLTVSIGSFTKGLNTADYLNEYAALTAVALVCMIAACLLLKKQEK